jgi:MFS family permease
MPGLVLVGDQAEGGGEAGTAGVGEPDGPAGRRGAAHPVEVEQPPGEGGTEGAGEVVALLVGGRIGDRSGHKRVYLAGVAVFALGSALCAAAPTAGTLVAFRVLQGTGAAIELPATLAILTHTFTGARERAQAVGIWTSSAGSSLVIGPVLGGGLVAAFGWR